MNTGKGSDLDNIDGFNYRLLKHENQHGDWHAVHEVFYNDSGEPVLCSVNPIEVRSPLDSDEPKEDVENALQLIREALDKPIINYKYFDNL